jgi:hypothetical protein
MSPQPLTTDEKVAFVSKALEPMAKFTFPFIGSVLKVESSAMGLHVGSALRLQLGSHRLLLSAHHVFQEASPQMAASGLRGESPIMLPGTPFFEDEAMDVRADEVPATYPALDGGFWPQADVDATDQLLATDFLFVHGFPAARSGSLSLLGGVVSSSLPYGAMLRDDDLPSDLETFQFAVDFDPVNFQTTDGSPADWIDPHGLSGSPVWRIGAAGGTVSEWSPSKARLVGVITQWRPDEKLLVATKLSGFWSRLLKSGV